MRKLQLVLALFAVVALLAGAPASATSGSWLQLGEDIDGESAHENFGRSVALSADGHRLAVGGTHVRAFEWSGSGWTRLGSEVALGQSVALSADGSRLAIGGFPVRVFEWSNGAWAQVGAGIEQEAIEDTFLDVSLALSSDGSRIAIGAPANNGGGTNSGSVRVFDWDGSEWVQFGSDLDGAANYEHFGSAIAMSADGSRLAVGAPNYGTRTGQVRVFIDFQGVGWAPLGRSMPTGSIGDRLGISVAMNDAGTRIAAGAPGGHPDLDRPGSVYVYDLQQTPGPWWQQVGDVIEGQFDGDFFGGSIALTADGTRLAVGAHLHEYGGAQSGHVRVFDSIDSTWQQVGLDIDGQVSGDHVGLAVAASADGSTIAVGAPNSSVNGDHSGHVRAFGGLDCNGSVVTVNLSYGHVPTAGDDVILGTPDADVIFAGTGNDIVCAGGGNDRVQGQAGDDVILGEAGIDYLRGGDGDDVVDGGIGNDRLFGDTGSDLLLGGDGRDVIRGGAGADTIEGGLRNDRLSGNAGADIIRGGNGRDTILGHVGDDTLFGGGGNDRIYGGGGNDRLNGQVGRDRCSGETLFNCEAET